MFLEERSQRLIQPDQPSYCDPYYKKFENLQNIQIPNGWDFKRDSSREIKLLSNHLHMSNNAVVNNQKISNGESLEKDLKQIRINQLREELNTLSIAQYKYITSANLINPDHLTL